MFIAKGSRTAHTVVQVGLGSKMQCLSVHEHIKEYNGVTPLSLSVLSPLSAHVYAAECDWLPLIPPPV